MESTTNKKYSVSEVLSELGLSITSEFVPFSKSRNVKEKHKSLNWRVTITHNKRPIHRTGYSAGLAHSPSYINSVIVAEQECETGITNAIGWNPVLRPDIVDVFYGLVSDASAIDCGSFEEWASELGYDTDSRKAEKAYRACLGIGVALRSAVGETGLERLREVYQDY